jgi:hypothetical protein
MKERPILMSAPMVRGTLRDIDPKTQTRRIVKPQPGTGVIPYATTVGGFNWVLEATGHGTGDPFPCPYGQPGDRLWVKEKWRAPKSLDNLSPTAIAEKAIDAGYAKPWAPIQYEADEVRRDWNRIDWPEPGKTRVSIHMPRWASRITLEIVNIRVERLQDISETDALAEGVERVEGEDGFKVYAKPWGKILKALNAGTSYRSLWESLNGPGSWDLNPWVWVVEFKRLETA